MQSTILIRPADCPSDDGKGRVASVLEDDFSMGDPLRTATDAFRRGAFADAAEALRKTAASAESAILSAKIDLRLKGAKTAYEGLTLARKAMRGAPRVLATALAATLAAAAGKNEDAESELAALSSPYPAKYADEIVYDVAAVRAMQGRHREAHTLLQSRKPKTAAMKAQYLLSLGWIEGSAERLSSQAALVQKALKLLLKEAPSEAWLAAMAAHTLAGLMRELRDIGSIETLVDAERRIAWTDELYFEHFQTLRCIGWRYALDGMYVRALFFLSRALSTAVTPGEETVAHLDHSFVAAWAGEKQSRDAELALADHAYEGIDWTDVRGEEAVAPVIAADAYADVDVRKARFFLNEARRRREKLPAHLGLAHGARFDAMQAAAEARVERHGDRDLAERAGKDAYQIFDRIGYDWRAARVALDLDELTGDRTWLKKARDHLQGYRENSLVVEVRRRETTPILSDRLREILHLLHQGLRPEEIAKRLGTSVHTVNNQIAKLFKLFKTSHRSELLVLTKEIA